jgi:hypothetical protein
MPDIDANDFSNDVLQIRDVLVSRAIDAINSKTDYSDEKKQGCINGLHICTDLRSIADFEAVLTVRQDAEIQHRLKINKMEHFWPHRYATAQIEFIYECMKVAVGSYGMHKTQSNLARWNLYRLPRQML